MIAFTAADIARGTTIQACYFKLLAGLNNLRAQSD
jgi:hypothetical protein